MADLSEVDATQALIFAFDPETKRLRTDSGATISDLSITHTDDSIKVGDGTDLLAINGDGSINTTSAVEASIVDEASGTITYVGKAVPGTATSAAGWRIFKITASGTITQIEWADGNSSYDNIWDNRAGLTYG